MSASGRLPGRIRDLRIEASRLDGLAQGAHDLASELYGRSEPADAAQSRAMDLDQTALDLRLQASALEAELAHAGLVEAVAALLAGA